MGGNVVATDAQNLGILFLEPLVETAERGGLVRSTTGEVQHVERQHDGLAAPVSVEGDVPMVR